MSKFEHSDDIIIFARMDEVTRRLFLGAVAKKFGTLSELIEIDCGNGIQDDSAALLDAIQNSRVIHTEWTASRIHDAYKNLDLSEKIALRVYSIGELLELRPTNS